MISESKHTPRPWTVGPEDTWHGFTYVPIQVARYAHDICWIVSDEDCEPNAALIAAAPDLLEALELFVRVLEGVRLDEKTGYPQVSITARMLRNAQSAIAKARGEE